MIISVLIYIVDFNGGTIPYLVSGGLMIDVTRLNGKHFVLNAELIEVMEETPDTVITLTTGHKYLVKESVDEVLEKVYTYKNRIINGPVNESQDSL